MKNILATVILLITTVNSHALTLYESATGPFDSVCCGGSVISNTQFIGAIFTLEEQVLVDGIGGHFQNFFGSELLNAPGSGGSIFGALIDLNETGFLSGSLSGLNNVITSTVFTPNSGVDTITPISETLFAGTYGLVFGSGLFGANGSTALTFLQPNEALTSNGDITAINTSSFLDWGLVSDDPNRYRITVTGTTVVPLPAGIWLFLSGLVFLLGYPNKNKSINSVIS